MTDRAGIPAWVWLCLLCSLNFFFMLGGHALWDVDEPNNAVCAREMLYAGNWWVPMFNGGLRFDKPILLYWLMMPTYSLLGVNEFAARLPSALAMTALTFMLFYFGRRLVNERTGFVAALLFASTLHVIVIGRAATPDPVFMLCVSFSLFALFCVERAEKVPLRLLDAAYAAMGLGVLAKGPVAVLMPAMAMGAYLVLMGRWRDVPRFRPWRGVVIIMAVALPWYVTVGVLTDGQWLREFILHHNIDRFAGALQGHRGFPGFYLVSVLLGAFPWSGLLMASLAYGVWRLQALRETPLRLFLLCWIGAFLVFFSVARTQLPNYMLPVFPACSLLMATWLHRAGASHRYWMPAGALMLSLLAASGAGIALERMWPGSWVYGLSFLPAAAAASFLLFRRAIPAPPVLVAGMTCSIVLLAGWALPALNAHRATPQLATAALHAGYGPRALATYRYFQPSLLFYHGGRLPSLQNAGEVRRWLAQGKAVVMPESALQEFPASMAPRLVIYRRLYGLYARRWLILMGMQSPGEEL